MQKPILNNRPRNLNEVVLCSRVHGNVYAFLREFLDEFYIETERDIRQQMLHEEPQLEEDYKLNAYLAAAEHLALRYELEVPLWTLDESRFLEEIFFPCQLKSPEIRDILLRESPYAFRRRMIFVDKDPLYRPRRAEPPEG